MLFEQIKRHAYNTLYKNTSFMFKIIQIMKLFIYFNKIFIYRFITRTEI